MSTSFFQAFYENNFVEKGQLEAYKQELEAKVCERDFISSLEMRNTFGCQHLPTVEPLYNGHNDLGAEFTGCCSEVSISVRPNLNVEFQSRRM